MELDPTTQDSGSRAGKPGASKTRADGVRNPYRPVAVPGKAGKGKHGAVCWERKQTPKRNKNRARGHRGPKKSTTKGRCLAQTVLNRESGRRHTAVPGARTVAEQRARLEVQK